MAPGVVAIAAAGTGGHIYPGLAVARELRRGWPGIRVVFVTTRRGLGPELFRRQGEEFYVISGEPAPLQLSWRLGPAGWALVWGAAEAARLLFRLRVNRVLATGGYGCAPTVAAARLLGIGVVWQEQNALPGRATRWMGRWARRVALGFAEAQTRLPARVAARAEYTGNPIRTELLGMPREEGARRLGLDPGQRVVVVVGASQGARRLNEAVVSRADELSRIPGVQVVVSTGVLHVDRVVTAVKGRLAGEARPQGGWRSANLHVLPYFDDMAAVLAVADLAVSRAGAISLAEFTARGVPLVLVPYPYAAEDHQRYNARVLEQAGAAVVVEDGAMDGAALERVIRELMGHPERLRSMARASARLGRPQATRAVAELVMEGVGRP